MTDKELKADLEELKKLESSATRPNVKNVIHQEIVRLEASLHSVDEPLLRSKKRQKVIITMAMQTTTKQKKPQKSPRQASLSL